MKTYYDPGFTRRKINGCSLSHQYFNDKLVFTIVYRAEYEQVKKKGLNLSGEKGCYVGTNKSIIDFYSGESAKAEGGVIGRVGTHFRDPKKDYIDFFIVITCNGGTSNSILSTNVILSLENLIENYAKFVGKTNVTNKLKTHYLADDLTDMENCMKAFAIIQEFFKVYNLTELIPVDLSLDIKDDKDIYGIVDGEVNVKFKYGTDLSTKIYKNSSFVMPQQLLLSDRAIQDLYRDLVSNGIFCPIVDDNSIVRVYVTRDLVCDTKYNLTDLTSLFINEKIDTSKCKKMWVNGDNKKFDKR